MKLLEKYVEYKKEGKIGTIILNRPELDLNTIKELIKAFKESKENEDNCVIFTGRGKNFVLGEDLKHAYEMITNPEMLSQAIDEIWSFQEITSVMMEHPGIIIAGYYGWVIGGGFEITLSCDLRIAADNTKIWMPELSLGSFFSNASTKILAWLIGGSRAKELMLMGNQITAKEAFNYGIVNQVCEFEKLPGVLRRLSKNIVKKSPLALKFAKQLINEGPENTINDILYKEGRALLATGQSEELKKGIEAFLKKFS